MQHASSFGLLDADHGEDDDDDDAVVVCVGHTALPNPAGAFISHQASLSSTFNSIVDTDTGSERENRSLECQCRALPVPAVPVPMPLNPTFENHWNPFNRYCLIIIITIHPKVVVAQ